MTAPKVLRLPYPPSVNTYWRHVGPKVLISARGRAYRRQVADAVGVPRDALSGRLAVHIDAMPPDRRKRDLDNCLKALLDAVTHAGVWHDDSQIDDLRVTRGPVEPGGCVVVRVEPTA